MSTLSHYGSFGHHNAVHKLVIIFSIILQQQEVCQTFNYVQEYHEIATSGYFHEEHSLTWDDLELQHLSKVNGPNLHSNGFHVINATFPGRQSSYILHISKTEGLFHPDQLGVSAKDASHLQCLYSGTINEVLNGVYSQSGIVSLSTCHHDFGFEGLLLLPQEQYYIRPNPSFVSQEDVNEHGLSKFAKRSTKEPKDLKPSVPHKAYKVNSPNGPYSSIGQIDEVHRVSPEDLLKAMKNQSGNVDALEDEGPPEESSKTDENSILEDTLIENDDCDDLNCKNSLPPVMAALSKGKGFKPKKPQKTPKAGASSASKVQVVEIAVFTDEKLYKLWKARYPKDTTTRMNQYVLAVINNMNALYKQPSMTENISFRLVHLEIETAKPRSMKDYNGHATKYLTSFCGYAAEKNQNGRLWDHALLLTGFDLNEDGSNSTAGIAWFSTMCINGYSCSVIEGHTFGSTFITSHEIGHSLGMEHDGTGPNVGCDANAYLMSPTTGGGKTEWSACSMNNLKTFIQKGHSRMGNPKPECITRKGSKAENPITFRSIKLPGQQFDANEQCEADCKGCKPYITKSAPYNDMCHSLYCQEIQGFFSIVRSSHPALEGTICGRGKVCRLGKCV